MVRVVFYGFDAHVIDLAPNQAEKDGRFPSLYPELQEPPLAVVCGESLFHGPRFEVEFGVLDGSEEIQVTLIIYDHGGDYQDSTSSSRYTCIRLQTTRYAPTRWRYGSVSRYGLTLSRYSSSRLRLTHRPFGLFVHLLLRGHPSQAPVRTAYLTYPPCGRGPGGARSPRRADVEVPLCVVGEVLYGE